MRFMFFGLGCVMISLAVIGALLPVMPTTIFLILAAWCFGKSSPRLETWLLDHPRFGPGLRRWREEGAIAPRAKLMAVSGMAFGYALFWVEAKPRLLLAGVVAVFMLSSAAYVVSRPKPRDAEDAMRDASSAFGGNREKY